MKIYRNPYTLDKRGNTAQQNKAHIDSCKRRGVKPFESSVDDTRERKSTGWKGG